jgi:hypothetical protein
MIEPADFFVKATLCHSLFGNTVRCRCECITTAKMLIQ